MSNEMIGRDVHYVTPGFNDHRAAKITRVQDEARGLVDLVVFHPDKVEFLKLIGHSNHFPNHTPPGTWHWPEQ